MKEIFTQYASYHLWANQRLIDSILLLTEEQQTRELTGSFPSLFKTLMHIHNVGIVWWQRMRMMEHVLPTNAEYKGSIKDLAAALIQQDKLWESWVHKASEAALVHVFHYQNTKREQFKQPVYQVLMQLFNHGTYHRGQLVNMFHELGVSNIPPTDFIVWSRGGRCER